MDSEQKSKILEKMQLMGEIEHDEKLLWENSQNTRMKSHMVESLLLLGVNGTEATKEVTPPSTTQHQITLHALQLS